MFSLLPLGSLHSVSPGLQWRDIRQWPRLRPPLRCRPWTWKSAQKGWFQKGKSSKEMEDMEVSSWKNMQKIIWKSSVNSRWGVFSIFVFDLAEGTLKYLEMSDCGVANEEIQHPTRGFWGRCRIFGPKRLGASIIVPLVGLAQPSETEKSTPRKTQRLSADSKLYWWCSTGYPLANIPP